MSIARWTLVPLLAVLGICIGVAVFIAILAPAMWFCPLTQSGGCTAPWFPWASTAAFAAGGAVGAFCTVALPSAFAPDHRREVALGIFGVGVFVALLSMGPTSLQFACAVCSGLAAVRVTWRSSAA
jgi:hypothetical protein